MMWSSQRNGGRPLGRRHGEGGVDTILHTVSVKSKPFTGGLFHGDFRPALPYTRFRNWSSDAPVKAVIGM